MGRVSHSWAASDVAPIAASRCILAATASSRPSRPEFQYSSPTFRPGILATTTVGTSSCRASPGVENATVDDTDTASTFLPSNVSLTRPFMYSSVLLHWLDVNSLMGPKHGRIRRGQGCWHWQRHGTVIELCYMWCICVDDYVLLWKLWIVIAIYMSWTSIIIVLLS
jgi:hypothetical protein